MRGDECRALIVDTERRRLEVHRVDREAGNGNGQPRLSDVLFVRVANHARDPAPGPAGVNTIEIDEAHGLLDPVGVRDARAQRARHERKVGIGVLRFFGPLCLGQFGPPLDFVVLVSRALGKHRPEQVDVGHDARATLIQARREALVQVSGGGVEGAAEDALVAVQRVAEAFGNPLPHVNDIDARPRDQLERVFQRCQWHRQAATTAVK